MAEINFEHIDPWVDGQGDTGLTSRQKLRRNFEKIKAWMDSVASMLSGKYLSKEDDDEAEGVITFKKGSLFGPLGAWGWVKQTVADRVGEGWAWFKNLLTDYLEALSALINGNLTVHGGDLTVEEDEQGNGGDAHIGGSLTVDGLTRLFEAIIQNLTVNNNFSVGGTATIHNLIVTGVAHFFKVIIDEIKAAGGALVLTAADGFNVDLVEDITLTLNGRSIAGKRLYWRATDGQRKRSNMWQAGDQALCKTDNLAEGTAYDVNNKYYWAVVAAVSPRPETKTIDGNDAQCHYIDIYCGSGESSIPTDGNDVPLWQGEPTTAAAGDEIAMLGSRSADTARQSALYFSAHSSLDAELTAPLLATYRGINDFTLSSHRKTYADAIGQAFFGKFYSSATDSDDPTDIEDWLTGSEIKIIYGEGSPLVTRPEQNWTQQDYANYADRCLYYDVSAEPAEDGGRFWKWTMQAGEENPTFGWEHVTDGDTLAALEKIADVASDSKLTGGGEKTRVLLNWKDSREYYTQTIAATPVEMTTSTESCMGSTFAAIYQAAQTAWTALCRYLNGDQAFDGGLQDAPLWISATLDANRVKKEAAADPAKWKACLLTTTVLPTLSEVQGETAADSYRRKWSEFYEAMATLAAAQLKWQEKKIDEMGDDGLLDPEEKASLRQIFAAEVKRYFRMLDDFNALGGTSAYYDDTHRLSNIVEEPLNIIATFMDGEGDIEFGAVSSPSGNPQQKGYFEQDGSSYKSTEDTSVVTGKTYYLPEMDLGTLTWQVNSAMRDGLTEEYDTTKAADARSGYPKWLLKANETVSQVVSDDLWDYFWNQYWSAANTMEARLTSAHQKSIDDIAEGLQPQIFIQATAPTNYKAGDHWYQPTTLKNPVTGANVSEDSNGNPIYNHYIAVVEDNTLKWKLVNAATTSVFSQLANQIYAAVFDSTRSSSVVYKVNSITSRVTNIENGTASVIEQLEDSISACVTKDGIVMAGLEIVYDEEAEEGYTVIHGDRTSIDGDLDVKGLITNSAQFIDYSDTYSKTGGINLLTGEDETVETGFVHDIIDFAPGPQLGGKMVVPIDLKKVKSVVIRGISKDTSISGDDVLDNTDPLVILPGYDSCAINGVLTMPAFHGSGTELTIASAFQRRYAKWRQAGKLTLKQLWECATVIVSDPRILKYNNTISISTTASGVRAHENSFIVNGQLGKVLILMPGQMVRLRSVVHKYGTGTTVLRWFVENAADFEPVTGWVNIWRASAGAKGKNEYNYFQAEDYYDNLALFAPGILAQEYGSDLCFNILSMDGLWPCVSKQDNIFNSDNTTNISTQ